MKILAVTDVHTAYRAVEKMLLRESPDLLIMGGDLTMIGSVKEAEAAIQMFQAHVERLLCVAGNMDLPQHDLLFEQLGISINGRGVAIGSIGIFGVSAAPISKLHTPYEISEEEITARAERGYKAIQSSAKRSSSRTPLRMEQKWILSIRAFMSEAQRSGNLLRSGSQTLSSVGISMRRAARIKSGARSLSIAGLPERAIM